jgi:formylglycine-generating enzyme required for sulfatase activity
MTRILSALFMLMLVQPAFAQRKINKTGDPAHAELQIYMVMVQGGNFDLGSDDEAADRRPAHTVKLHDYYMSAYEVTQLQWRTIMGTNPSRYICDECPVSSVTYTDALAFIEKLNTRTGKHYRLPTEAEWEYAARGGTHEELVKVNHNVARGGVNEFLVINQNQGTRVPDREKSGKKYSGKKLAGDVAWYERNSENHEHPIGRKKPNELGIYDMSGNVEEWCSDFYATTYGSKNTVEDPKGPSGGKSHVVRGGAYNMNVDEVGVTRRAGYLPNTKSMSLGFRLAEDK